MARKPPTKIEDEDKVNIEIESWQWETSSKRLTWKHYLLMAVVLAAAMLFVFGFLIIAAFLLFVGIIVNLVLFILKKFS